MPAASTPGYRSRGENSLQADVWLTGLLVRYTRHDLYWSSPVFRIFSLLAGALALGSALALLSVRLGLPVGLAGAAALIVWAILARRRWEQLRHTGGPDPVGAARIAWHRAMGVALIGGHLLTGVLHPGLDLHVGAGNWIAIDSWTLVAGFLASAWVIRGDRHGRDERDLAIAARATQAGYLSLIVSLIGLTGWLATLPPGAAGTMDAFFVANLIVALIVLSKLVQYTVQLVGYAPDADALADELQ